MSFASLIQAYLDDLKLRRCSPSTRVNTAAVLPRFFDHLKREKIRDVRRVAEEHVVSYTHRLATATTPRGTPLSVATQASYLAVVKAFFGFLERRKLILQDPARGVPLPARRRLPRALSEREVRRLVSAPDSWTVKGRRDRALLDLLYGTGLRMSECVRLDLSDVDLSQGLVLVRDGKGRKDRLLPLSGRARAALELYLRESRPELVKTSQEAALFLSKYGLRLGGLSVRVLVRRYGQAVGIKASTHVLRHSYATHLLQGGASIREIQVLLGHKDLATTALYTKVDTRGLATMLRRCHPRERR